MRHTLVQRAALPAGARVVAAVSGGSDSVALALLLRELDRRGVLVFAGIAHLHHQLRGAAANDDLIFCQELAERLGVPFEEANADVAALAAARGESLEAAGRRARYDFFETARVRLLATHVATGHTMDDQAETVLLRLMRGAGARGVSGIRPLRGTIVRPLLDCRRDDLRAWLGGVGQPFRHDATNDDLTIPRNRVRHDVLPPIAAAAPGAVEALARAARLAADDEDFLQARAIEAARTVVLSDSGDDLVLSASALTALAPAIGRRVVRDALAHLAPAHAGAIGAAHIDGVVVLAAADPASNHAAHGVAGGHAAHVGTGFAGNFDVPGVHVARGAEGVRLRAHGAPTADETVMTPFAYRLDVPGAVTIPESRMVMTANVCDQTPADGVEGNKGAARRTARQVEVDVSALTLPLTVRNRRPGDRIKPLGAIGRKKLQDLLVDLKVPRERRDRIPVVVDAAGRLVWVVGVTVADECRPGSAQAKVVTFRVEGR